MIEAWAGVSLGKMWETKLPQRLLRMEASICHWWERGVGTRDNTSVDVRLCQRWEPLSGLHRSYKVPFAPNTCHIGPKSWRGSGLCAGRGCLAFCGLAFLNEQGGTSHCFCPSLHCWHQPSSPLDWPRDKPITTNILGVPLKVPSVK
jgi:hypothetical protein